MILLEKANTKDNFKIFLIGIFFILFSIFLVGIFYLFTSPLDTVNYAFSYVAGLSMIVLPCTLPLAFVIVPLSMGKEPKKGFIMALLFGLGLTITITVYAIVIAVAGNVFGLDQVASGAGVVSRVLFLIGGGAALIFGLSELKLINLSLPMWGGMTPKFIENQQDYLKALFLGLFLGNAGVGCPNPLFYILLGDIAVQGSVLNGALLGFVHGIGRATPLIFLAILGILGVNATGTLVKHRDPVEKIIGWGLVLLGIIIIMLGAAHEWTEDTFLHGGWNKLIEAVGGIPELEVAEHTESVADFIPQEYSLPLLIILLLVPLLLYYLKKRKGSNKNAES